MGVKRLSDYMMNSLPRGYEEIDILREITKFKNESDISQPATIIFDVMGFIHCFCQTNEETILGGRHNIYIESAEKLFQTLSECGAKLVFCCDGQLHQSRINVWCERKDRQYTDGMNFLACIDRGQHCSGRNYRSVGSKYFVHSLLETAKRFGTVIMATDRDCDSIAAQYATANDALAIVASDSDYLIYEGNWQLWHVNSLCLKTCTVKRFNRTTLIEHLRLTRDQMKAFAIMAGNDYTSFCGKPFQTIADMCRTIDSVRSDSSYQKIAAFMEQKNQPDLIETIRKSIESYDIDFEPDTDVDRLERYIRENVLMHAILRDGIFQYEVNYVDFGRPIEKNDYKNHNNNNNNHVCRENFLERIFNVVRRLAGILLDKSDRKHFRMMTKHSSETKYELTYESPNYPNVEMPTLYELIFGTRYTDGTRSKLLMWCLDFNEQFYKKFAKIPIQLKMVVLSLAFLYGANEISLQHADALLITECTLSGIAAENANARKCKPKKVIGTVVRSAQAYNRTMTLVRDCLTICGLQRFIRNSYFDGFYFHNVCLVPATVLDDEVKRLKEFRLYAEPSLYRK